MATKVKIADTTAEVCKSNMALMGELMGMFQKTQKTIERWFDSGNSSLTSEVVVNLISKHTGLPKTKILVEDVQKAA